MNVLRPRLEVLDQFSSTGISLRSGKIHRKGGVFEQSEKLNNLPLPEVAEIPLIVDIRAGIDPSAAAKAVTDVALRDDSDPFQSGCIRNDARSEESGSRSEEHTSELQSL